MSYDQLAQMRIAFGETKVNQTFQEVVETDPKYVQWFTRKYGDSQKATHRPFLYFVELYVERMELIQDKPPRGEQVIPTPGLQAKAKMAPRRMPDMESEDEWSEPGSVKPWSMVQEENLQIQAEMSAQRERISNMENSLSQIMQQLQALTQMTAQSSQGQIR